MFDYAKGPADGIGCQVPDIDPFADKININPRVDCVVFRVIKPHGDVGVVKLEGFVGFICIHPLVGFYRKLVST